MPSSPRRLTVLRWVPLAILTAAAGLGTGLGLALSGSSAPVVVGTGRSLPAGLEAMVRATTAAGTARFSYRSLTVGPGPDRHGGSVLTGSGVVDFRSDSYRTGSVQSETDTTTIGSGPPRTRQVEVAMREVLIRGRVYQQLTGFPAAIGSGSGSRAVPWIRFPKLTGLHSPFDAFQQSEASQALAPLSDPDQRVTLVTVGPATVGGVATTHQRATFTSLPDRCLPRDRQSPSSSRMDLWVDGRGRLVQVRTTIRQVVPPVPRSATGAQPGGVPDPVDLSGTIVTSATLRLSDFGLPVHISVPHPLAETGSFGVVIARATSCPAGRH